jgi:TonB family protein
MTKIITRNRSFKINALFGVFGMASLISCAGVPNKRSNMLITNVLNDSCWIGKVDTSKCKPTDARIISLVDPIYPRKARLKGIEAKVKVKVKMGKLGYPSDIQVLESGGEEFDNAVKLAIIKTRYTPLYINCEPAEYGFVRCYKFFIE